MTAKELRELLEDIPPLTEVYIQTSATALEKVKYVRYDQQLGCVELLTK